MIIYILSRVALKMRYYYALLICIADQNDGSG